MDHRLLKVGTGIDKHYSTTVRPHNHTKQKAWSWLKSNAKIFRVIQKSTSLQLITCNITVDNNIIILYNLKSHKTESHILEETLEETMETIM